MQAALDALSSYDWILFTSANGVQHFFGNFPDLRLSQKAAAVGPGNR